MHLLWRQVGWIDWLARHFEITGQDAQQPCDTSREPAVLAFLPCLPRDVRELADPNYQLLKARLVIYSRPCPPRLSAKR